MDSQKQQASERIKQANNILVTVSNNPSVDQLAACIGLTLSLNKMGKHATAVFSGAIPSTIEFLQPEKTIEKNTDSLRDFIIALDKSKADKLRYKVEDRVVKIFITPYRTSISDKDLEFSQGDFNVDVVLALGVHNQADLDQAITSHGRILHDATIITLNTKPGGELGSINWLEPNASSLSELAVRLVDALDKKLVDGQISTAFLTGIVAETERFSNSKTSPETMSISAELMSEGANQQLVATKLQEPVAPPPPVLAPIAQQEPAASSDKSVEKGTDEVPAAKKNDDGTLEISHEEDKKAAETNEPAPQSGPEDQPKEEKPQPAPEEPKSEEPVSLPEPMPVPEEPQPEPAPQIHIDEHGSISPLGMDMDNDILPPLEPKAPPSISHHAEAPKMVIQPPTMGTQSATTNAPGAFAETNDGLALPPLEEPRIIPDPSAIPIVAPTSTPPTETGEESPSGGAAAPDSFIVGAPQAATNPTASPSSMPNIPIVPAATETLSEIEQQLGSPHAAAAPSQDAATLPAPSENGDLHSLSSAPVVAGQPLQPVLVEPQVQPTVNDSLPEVNTNDVPDTHVPDVNGARDAVSAAFGAATNPPLQPIDALNANPVNLSFGNVPANQPASPQVVTPEPDYSAIAPVQPWTPPQDGVQPAMPAGLSLPGTPPQENDPNAPPPVPPPMMPPTNPF